MSSIQEDYTKVVELLKTVGFVEERIVDGKKVYVQTPEGLKYFKTKIFNNPIEVGKA